MWNDGLDEAQAGIKIAGKNINNVQYADDTTFMAEIKEELKNLLMKVKEESEKVDLKLNIQETKIMTSGPITSWQIDGETMETVRDFSFLGSKITADGDWSREIKKCMLLGRKDKPRQHIRTRQYTSCKDSIWGIKEVASKNKSKPKMCVWWSSIIFCNTDIKVAGV